MDSISDFKAIFEPFRKEKSSTIREAVETLITITRNVLESNDQKYRRIKTLNASFVNKVWKHDVCQRLLFAVGWTLDKDANGIEIIRITETHHLPAFLDFLMSERVSKPKTNESIKMQSNVKAKVADEERRKNLQQSKQMAKEAI
ncbi:hypothetical protein B4U80_14842, partial [Leptotrombidium deliense]